MTEITAHRAFVKGYTLQHLSTAKGISVPIINGRLVFGGNFRSSKVFFTFQIFV